MNVEMGLITWDITNCNQFYGVILDFISSGPVNAAAPVKENPLLKQREHDIKEIE